MRHTIISIATLCATAVSAYPAADITPQQVLVFRNTGEINLFYSDEIKSIETVFADAEGNLTDEATGQRFVFEDHSIYIPISEIDSVAIGPRNIIDPKKGVRRLTDQEVALMESFNGESIRYKAGTPISSIPSTGERIYYDEFTTVFPYGLCAEVVSLTSSGSRMVHNVKELAPDELFNGYFHAGEDASARKKALDLGFYYNPEGSLPEIEIDGIKINGKISCKLGVGLENGVANPLTGYYHGIFKIHITPKLEISATSDDSNEYSNESKSLLNIPIKFLGGTIQVALDVRSFLDVAAELGIKYEFTDDLFISVEWTRRNGKDTFGQPIFSRLRGDLSSSLEAHLNGTLFFGPKIDLSIGVLFDRIGAGIELKAGPKMDAEFSMGVLQELSEEYSQDAYAKAKIEMALHGDISTYYYNHKYFIFGDKEKHPLPFTANMDFFKRTLNLFPEFHTRSTLGKESGNVITADAPAKAVTIATYTETPIEQPLEIGFELADAETDETIKQVFSNDDEPDIIENGNDRQQTFNSEIALKDELASLDTDNAVPRPVFRYLGKVIKAAPTTIGDDIFYSPVIYTGSHKGRYIVSGMPIVNSASSETTTFIEGNLMPTASANDKFRKGFTASLIETIDLETPPSGGGASSTLTGNWSGNLAGEQVALTFSDSSNGTYNGIPFSYRVNTPFRGGVSITLSDGRKISFYVVGLTADTLTVKLRNSKKTYTLTR